MIILALGVPPRVIDLADFTENVSPFQQMVNCERARDAWKEIQVSRPYETTIYVCSQQTDT